MTNDHDAAPQDGPVNTPADASSDRDTGALCAFLYEVGHLKRAARTGWWVAGVPARIESIAEHSFRTAIIAHVLAALEGADPARAAVLALYHDLEETRVGDIPHLGRHYLTAMNTEAVVKDQTADLPTAVATPIREAVAEYQGHRTLEAVCAKDADKLDCLVQAREYQIAGARDVDTWIQVSAAKLQTRTAQQLAESAIATSPGIWWRNVQAAHRP